MKNFRNGQRVTVAEVGHPLTGRKGSVVRLRRADNGAWVRMDDRPPEELCPFPVDDSRGHDVVLYPDQCKPVTP